MTKAMPGILLAMSTEEGREMVSTPTKLYMGSGQRTPLRMLHRSMVTFTGLMPYTLTSKLAETLTFSSYEASELMMPLKQQRVPTTLAADTLKKMD